MAEYITCANTAKLIRKALKREFPGQKFYVRSKTYSGGASISIDWIDGPPEKEIKAITCDFEGAGFDGMIDMKYYYTSWLLPDGSAITAGTQGTTGSVGTVEGFSTTKPHPDARQVSFGANYIFLNRAYTRTLVEKVAAEVAKETGWESPEIQERTSYLTKTKTVKGAWFVLDFQRDFEIGQFCKRLAETSAYTKLEKPEPPTLAASSPPQTNTENPNASYTVEHDRNWTWIRFVAPPAESIKDALCGLGARHSRKRGAWYIRERIETAVVYTALTG